MSASSTPLPATAASDVDGLMTLGEVAEVLACKPAGVRRWISEGRLPCVKLGRLARVRRRDVLHVISHGLAPHPALTTVAR